MQKACQTSTRAAAAPFGGEPSLADLLARTESAYHRARSLDSDDAQEACGALSADLDRAARAALLPIVSSLLDGLAAGNSRAVLFAASAFAELPEPVRRFAVAAMRPCEHVEDVQGSAYWGVFGCCGGVDLFTYMFIPSIEAVEEVTR